MNLDINIFDYISQEEIQGEIKYQIKNYIKKICTEDQEVKKVIVALIIDKVKDIELSNIIKNELREKIEKIIKDEYLNADSSWNLKYDAGMTEKIKTLFNDNFSQFSPILEKKMKEAVDEYKPDNYIISELAQDLLLKDEQCVTVLKETLSNRIYEIIEKF